MKQPVSSVALHHALDKDWRSPKGWRSLSAVNHTAVGRRFIVAALVFFMIGGVLAMLLRAQLATSGNAFLDSDAYNQVFTMHGTVMMFLFAIPMLEGFSFYLLPKMLGARDLAFPRLGAYGWWCYLAGGLILVAAMVLGLAPDSGWFMYTPLSGPTYRPGINSDIWLIGVTFAEISAICGAVELIATILKLRAPGMGLNRMPIFAWYMLVTAGMILVGFPPLILGSILLEVERAFGWPFFDVMRGGDPLLWQHLFWLFGHPEVYIIFLPAAGMVSTMIPVFAQRPLAGYVWVVGSVAAVGFLSFGLWVHHMFTVGIPQLSVLFFSAASMLVTVPTAVQFFAWIATLWSGDTRFRLPMLYLAGFLAVFVTGGLTGVMLALVPFNWQAHDTHFVVAHLHYVLTGGMVFPLLAAACYWMPHITGRMPSGRTGTTAFWLIFVGFNLTFLPMHLTGLVGMPRRIYTYPPDAGWDTLNLLSSLGAFIQAMGFLVFVLDMFLHGRAGRRAPRNPWNAGTLEWAMPVPPPSYNFASLPDVQGREPLWDNPALGVELAGGRHWLGKSAPGQRQTLSVDISSGIPRSVVQLPGPSWLPFYAAIATGVFFICVLFKLYMVALAGAVAALLIFLRWAWQNGAREDPGAIEAAPEIMLPPHFAATSAPGWWGMACSLAANAALFASLLFGYLFLWTMAPNWPPPAWITISPIWGTLAACVPVATAAAVRTACGANDRGRRRACSAWFLAGSAAGVIAVLAVVMVAGPLPPATSHAYVSTSLILLCYAGLHLAVTSILAFYLALRCRAGYISPIRALEPAVLRMWSDYTAMAAVAVMATLYGLPWVFS